MNQRIGAFYIFSGTNGTGKTTQLKKLLTVNRRNLIIPANRLDSAWHGYKELEWKHRWVTDPNDYNGKKKIKKWYLPELNSFTGTRLLHIDEPWQFKYICETSTGFTNGGLFIDDYKNHIKSAGILPNHVRRLLGDRRHRTIDLFIASHSLQDINAEFMQFKPTMFIFNVTRPPSKSVLEKTANSEELVNAYRHVLAQNAKLPKDEQYYFVKFIPS